MWYNIDGISCVIARNLFVGSAEKSRKPIFQQRRITMKTAKKVLALFLAVVMCVGLISTVAFADEMIPGFKPVTKTEYANRDKTIVNIAAIGSAFTKNVGGVDIVDPAKYPDMFAADLQKLVGQGVDVDLTVLSQDPLLTASSLRAILTSGTSLEDASNYTKNLVARYFNSTYDYEAETGLPDAEKFDELQQAYVQNLLFYRKGADYTVPAVITVDLINSSLTPYIMERTLDIVTQHGGSAFFAADTPSKIHEQAVMGSGDMIQLMLDELYETTFGNLTGNAKLAAMNICNAVSYDVFSFYADFRQDLEYIKWLNPFAKVIVVGGYNDLEGLKIKLDEDVTVDFGSFWSSVIALVNSVICNDEKSAMYYFADVTSDSYVETMYGSMVNVGKDAKKAELTKKQQWASIQPNPNAVPADAHYEDYFTTAVNKNGKFVNGANKIDTDMMDFNFEDGKKDAIETTMGELVMMACIAEAAKEVVAERGTSDIPLAVAANALGLDALMAEPSLTNMMAAAKKIIYANGITADYVNLSTLYTTALSAVKDDPNNASKTDAQKFALAIGELVETPANVSYASMIVANQIMGHVNTAKLYPTYMLNVEHAFADAAKNPAISIEGLNGVGVNAEFIDKVLHYDDWYQDPAPTEAAFSDSETSILNIIAEFKAGEAFTVAELEDLVSGDRAALGSLIGGIGMTPSKVGEKEIATSVLQAAWEPETANLKGEDVTLTVFDGIFNGLLNTFRTPILETINNVFNNMIHGVANFFSNFFANLRSGNIFRFGK